MAHKLLILLFCFLTLYAVGRSHKAKTHTGSIFTISAAALAMEYTTILAKDGHILIYPNPASDHIYMKGDAQTSYTIELINMLGAVVHSEDVTDGLISIAGLQPGIYIVRVYGSDGQLYLASKITKQAQ